MSAFEFPPRSVLPVVLLILSIMPGSYIFIGTIKLAMIFMLALLHQMELFIILMNVAFMLMGLTGNSVFLLP